MEEENKSQEIQEFMDTYGKDLIAQVVQEQIQISKEQEDAVADKPEGTFEDEPIPKVDFSNLDNLALVCVLGKDNYPVLYEFMPVKEARIRAKRIIQSF